MHKFNKIFHLLAELFLIVSMRFIIGTDAGWTLALSMLACIGLDILVLNAFRILHVPIRFLPTNAVALKRVLPYALIALLGLLICL